MMLSDRDIQEKMYHGDIGISPFNPEVQLQPASVDLTLGNLAVVDDVTYDLTDGGLWLLVNRFALVSTQETVTLSDYVAAKVEGKSSLARLGLLVHFTAGFIDPGFSGQITLELMPFKERIFLKPGMKISQICFFELSSPAVRPYGTKSLGSKYQGQAGPTESRYSYE